MRWIYIRNISTQKLMLLLKYTPNVINISIDYCHIELNQIMKFDAHLPKLNDITIRFSATLSQQLVDSWIQFVNEYSQQINRMYIDISDFKSEIFNQLPHFPRLTTIIIYIWSARNFAKCKSCIDWIRGFARNCEHLENLYFRFYLFNDLTGIFNAIRWFRSIVSLSLVNYHRKDDMDYVNTNLNVDYGDIRFLNCKNLIELRLCTRNLSDKHLNGIDRSFPQLRRFYLTSLMRHLNVCKIFKIFETLVYILCATICHLTLLKVQ